MKNHGVKLFFVCTFKNEKLRILKFSRLGVPGDTQTFEECSPETLAKFRVDGWYRLGANLDNMVECDHAEPYKVDHPKHVREGCRICTAICYFEVNSYRVCDHCASKLHGYRELLVEMGETYDLPVEIERARKVTPQLAALYRRLVQVRRLSVLLIAITALETFMFFHR